MGGGGGGECQKDPVGENALESNRRSLSSSSYKIYPRFLQPATTRRPPAGPVFTCPRTPRHGTARLLQIELQRCHCCLQPAKHANRTTTDHRSIHRHFIHLNNQLAILNNWLCNHDTGLSHGSSMHKICIEQSMAATSPRLEKERHRTHPSDAPIHQPPSPINAPTHASQVSIFQSQTIL